MRQTVKQDGETAGRDLLPKCPSHLFPLPPQYTQDTNCNPRLLLCSGHPPVTLLEQSYEFEETGKPFPQTHGFARNAFFYISVCVILDLKQTLYFFFNFFCIFSQSCILSQDPLQILNTEIILLILEDSCQLAAEERVNEANLSLALSAVATRTVTFPMQK